MPYTYKLYVYTNINNHTMKHMKVPILKLKLYA